MAHFSEQQDESDVSKVAVPQGCRNDVIFLKTDIYVELGGADGLRSLFDKVLSYFLKWVSVNKDAISGFPPKLGDGVEADLFTLFWVVRKIGDYELVSKNELWEFVAEECGLDVTHVGSLKLIYTKYLKELDQWLSHGGFKDTKLENGELGVLQKLDSLFRNLTGCKYSLSNVQFGNDKGKCVVINSSDGSGIESALDFNDTNLDMAKTEIGFSRFNKADEKNEEFGKLGKVDVSRIDKVNAIATNNKNDTMIAKTIVKNVDSSQKRNKEESSLFLKMLDWVANAARNPHDVAIGSIPNSSKWKKYKSDEVWKQVLMVKDTLFANRNVKPGNHVYGSQKKRHMMHPSMYEDDKIPAHVSSKRTYLQRGNSVKSCSCPGCKSCLSSKNKRQKPDIQKSHQIPETVNIQDDECKDLETKIVTVGAEVPEWTGVVSESDPKWLGTRMWPPLEDKTGKHQKDLGVIGKGIQRRCRCLDHGSADCVRFHIALKRKKVKRMLGPLFYKWKFNHMGEEASCSSWSLEEETQFKSLVIKARQELTHTSKSRHEIMSNFWRRASESIPCKTKDVLVSYYFNVFVLRRRSYQNRIMPENIDSDDDEQEVGYEKIHALSVKRSKNRKGTNLES